MVNRNLGSGIDYKISPLQERHRYHAVVQLQLKKEAKPGPVKKESTMEKMLSFAKQGWKEAYLPKNYIFPNAAQTKFYFAGEIPEHIFREKDDNVRAALLKTWAAKTISQKYGVTEEQLEYRQSRKTPAKDRLQCTVFEMQISVANKPLVDLSAGVFAQVGDARRTPNYNLAHGMNDAIKGGIAFADAINGQDFKKEEFIKTVNMMDTRVEKIMAAEQLEIAVMKEVNQQRLLGSIDRFISHIKQYPENKNMLATLSQAKNEFKNNNNLTTVYNIIHSIEPVVAIHKNTSFPYRFFRGLVSLLFKEATQTKSTILLEEVKDKLETYSNQSISF